MSPVRYSGFPPLCASRLYRLGLTALVRLPLRQSARMLRIIDQIPKGHIFSFVMLLMVASMHCISSHYSHLAMYNPHQTPFHGPAQTPLQMPRQAPMAAQRPMNSYSRQPPMQHPLDPMPARPMGTRTPSPAPFDESSCRSFHLFENTALIAYTDPYYNPHIPEEPRPQRSMRAIPITPQRRSMFVPNPRRVTCCLVSVSRRRSFHADAPLRDVFGL